MAVRDEVHRLHEAAKNPDHWINDGLKITLQKN